MSERIQFLESVDRALQEETGTAAILQLFEEYNVGKDAFLAFEACSKVLDFGAVETFLQCIERGYAVDLKDKSGYSLFDRVVVTGNLRLAKLVQEKWTEILTKRNAARGRLSILDFNVRFINKLNGENALHLLAKTHYKDSSESEVTAMAKWLIEEQGVSLIKNKAGDTALHFAIKAGKLKLAMHLAQFFQDKEAMDTLNGEGMSPWHLLQQRCAESQNNAVLQEFKSLLNGSKYQQRERLYSNVDTGFEYLYKIIVIGNASVGKTFVLSRYINGSCPARQPATVGVEIAVKLARLKNGDR